VLGAVLVHGVQEVAGRGEVQVGAGEGGVRYRIMTLPLTQDGTWSWDFATPDGWVLVSVLDGPLASTRQSGWDHVTVLLWQQQRGSEDLSKEGEPHPAGSA
jgi:hypothetical protein